MSLSGANELSSRNVASNDRYVVGPRARASVISA